MNFPVIFCHNFFSKTQCFSWFRLELCQTYNLASLFSSQAWIRQWVIWAWQCFFFFSMLGDPTILGDTATALTTAGLLNAVTVKFPPFWPDNIKSWLVQLESQFCLKGVSLSHTKLDYVVQSMSQGNTMKVRAPACLLATSPISFSTVPSSSTF